MFESTDQDHFLSLLHQIKLVPSPDNVCLFLGAMVHFKSNFAKEELVLKKKIIRYLHYADEHELTSADYMALVASRMG